MHRRITREAEAAGRIPGGERRRWPVLASPRAFVALGLGWSAGLGGAERLPAAPAGAWPGRAELIASPEAGWPQFRGPRRDGISDERGLLPVWPEAGPKLVWSVRGAGRGFSSAIVGGGRVYLTGDFGEDLYVLAFDRDGNLLWRTKNGDSWLNQYQGARGSVTFRAGRVYHQNAHGRVTCLDAATGGEIWSVNVLERFRGENITWGLSDCLLVDERAVYAVPGGRDALLVALDARTGETRWRSEPLTGPETKADAGAGYGPPILLRFAGRRLIVGCSSRYVFCADADSGKIQWTRSRPTAYAVLAMSPVLVGDAVFMTAPHGPPGTLHRLLPPAGRGGNVGVADGWITELDTAQGGVVQVNGRLFGSYYPPRRGWAALDAITGAVLFEAPDLVKGCAVYADGRLYALSEDGWMRLLQDTGTRFEIAGRFRLAKPLDRDAWAHPSICDGRLYLRYHDTLSCYDIRAGTPAVAAEGRGG